MSHTPFVVMLRDGKGISFAACGRRLRRRQSGARRSDVKVSGGNGRLVARYLGEQYVCWCQDEP
jgi:hypothetical protein